MKFPRLLLRSLKVITLTLLTLLFSLSLLITLFFSQPRLHLWLFSQLDSWTDGMVSVAHSEGHLFDSISLHDIAIRHPALDIDIDRLDWRVNLFHLWYGRLSLEQLHLHRLHITLHESEPSPPSPLSPEPFAALMGIPWLLDIEALRIDTAHLHQAGQDYQIADLHSAISWQLRRLQLKHLSLRHADQHIKAHGRVNFIDSSHLSGRLRLDVDSASLPSVALQADWRGALDQLALELEISQPFSLQSQHQLSLRGFGEMQLQSQWQGLHYAIDDQTNLRSPQGNMQLHLDPHTLDAKGEFSWQLNDFPLAEQSFTTQFDLHDQIHFELGSEFSHAGHLQLTGQLSVAEQHLTAQLHSEQLQLEGFASPVPLHYSGKADIQLQNFSSPRLQLQLTETSLHLPDQDIHIEGALGMLATDLTGRPSFLVQLADLLIRQGEHQILVNGPLVAELDGLEPPHGHLSAPQPLQLLYRGQLASLALDLQLHETQQLVIKQLQLDLGDNRLQASGQFGETLQLVLAGRLNRLDQILPELAGSLQLKARLDGEYSDPQLDLTIATQQARWQDLQLTRARLHARLPLITPWLGSGNIQLDGLQQGEQTLLESLQLQRRPVDAYHHNELSVVHPQLTLHATLRDRYRTAEPLQLTLLSLEAQETRTGKWQLSNPATIRGQAPLHLESDRVCLRNLDGMTDAHLCLQASAARLDWQLQQLPVFHWMRTLLPEGMTADALFDGSGQLTLGENLQQDWQLQQRIHSPMINLAINQQGYLLPLQIHDWALQLDANPLHARLSSSARLNQTGKLDLQLRLDNQANNWMQAPLSGQLNAHLNEADLPADLLSLLVIEHQQLSLGSQFSGSLAAPIHDTVAKLLLLFDLPLMGLAQQHLALEARLDSDKLVAHGQLTQAEQRQLQFEATLQGLQQGQPHGQVHLHSEDVQIIDSQFASIHTAPDLRFELREGALHISGDTHVHHSRLDLRGLPLQGRSSVSADEILLDAKGEPVISAETALPVYLNTTLHFGDQVEVLVRDVNAFVGGQLTLSLSPGQTLHGQGQVVLDQGQIRLDPRNTIEIDRSTFSFTGVLSNPSLNVQLSRRVEEINARLNITGTATQPQFVFYSTPSLSQGNIINIMIFGRAVDVTQEPNYESQLLSALYKLGLHGNTPALSQLTSSLGIHDIYFDIQDEQSSNLILGRALTDRLYIRYAVGLSAQQTNTVQLFYRLGKRWVLESKSGDDVQSLDIIWTKEQ